MIEFAITSVKPRTADNITKQVEHCLQMIFKNEYGDAYDGDLSRKDARKIMEERNPQLANLTPVQALANLKSELKAYVDGDDLFNRQFRPK